MTYECFDVQIANNIAHVILNRPEKRNSMAPIFWDELPAIIQDIDHNAKARVIVISSTGPHFSSGLDVAMFSGSAVTGEQTDDPSQKKRTRLQKAPAFMNTVQIMQDSFSTLENCRLPVLAAIQGGCIGGGVDLVTACDMRYATEDSFLTIFETNIGMTADVGTFPRLVKLIPEGIVRELAYTGRRMSAREAMSVGLVNQVFGSHEDMLTNVMAIAAEIARKAPLAVHGCKRAITYARDHSTSEGLEFIGLWNASMLQSEEIMEAMSANAEKRDGDFVDLPKWRRKSAS